MKTRQILSITTISILFLLANFCQAQRLEQMLIPFEKDGLWGYVNYQKDIVVPASYQEAYPTYNFRGRVKKNGKYGFIDEKGKLVIKCKFEEADDFAYGLARVSRKGKESFIKKNGKKNKVSIGICGTHGGCFYPRMRHEVVFKDADGKYGFVTKLRYQQQDPESPILPDTIPAQFDRVIPVTHQLMLVEQNGKFSFIDEGNFRAGAENVLKSLNFIYEDYELFSCFYCSEGTHKFIGIKQDGWWALMDVTRVLQVIVAPKYHSVSSLARGYGLVEFEQGKYGYIDKKGNEYFLDKKNK